MNKFFLVLLCSFLVLAHIVAQNQKSKIIKKGAELTQVASDYDFTEGPAVNAAGEVFFTDQPNNRILRWSEQSGISTFMENAGRSNGLYFDHDGKLLACADEKNELWRIGMDRKVDVLLTDLDGKKFNGPNDLWVDPAGGIYFTDPFYKRPYWDRDEQELEARNVYYLAPGESQAVVAAEGFVQPNGIVGNRDGTILYVADIGDKKTYRYDIVGAGQLGKRTLMADMGSDGMTLDHKGHLYITGQGVTVFDASGKKIEHIEVPERWTANVCFGGKKQRTLFITAMGSVYTLQMKVKGIR